MIRLRQRAQGKPGARTVRQRQEEAARTARVSHQLLKIRAIQLSIVAMSTLRNSVDY